MSSILDKIRKLLALSKSASANEAAAAAAVAQRLMQEHRIAEAELETGEPTETAQLSADPIDTFGKRSVYWKEQLCGGLLRLHGCKGWKETTWTGNTCVRRLQIVGRASDVANVRYLYAWLTSEIERLAQRDTKGRGAKYGASYRSGAVRGSLSAMAAADVAVRATANPAALVRLDAREQEAAAAAAASADPRPARKSAAKLDAEAYRRGVTAGHGLHTGAKLGAATGARLLGSGS